MDNKRRRYILILVIVLAIAFLIVYLVNKNQSNNSSTTINTKPPGEAIAVVESYIQARENSVGADQSSATSWLREIKPIVTAIWYKKLQPTQNNSTSTTSFEYTTAHSSGFMVKSSVDNCAWDLETAMPSPTSGTIFCQLTDTTVYQKSGSTVPVDSLPFGWTRSGKQSAAIISVLKQGNDWFVSSDNTGESE